MRLVCPNCAAQYEVDASLLPDEGTDVQCSACNTVWFQPGAEKIGVASEPVQHSAPVARPARPQPQEQDGQRRNRPSGPAAETAGRAEPAGAKVADTEAERPAPPTPPTAEPDPEPASPPPTTRSLDPSVAEVLRQEADFESKQRAQETSSLEMQPELGLFGPAVGSTQHRGGASRLPDIDDISSTLEPFESGRGGQSGLPQTRSARKRSFIVGLALPVGLAGALTALYLSAPTLAQLVPAFDAPLHSFVALVDEARLGVASLIGLAR